MASPADLLLYGLYYALTILPFLGIAIAALYAGYVAYDTRLRREAQARERALAPPRPDPVAELKRLNDETERALVEARQTLASARDTIHRGTKG